MFSSEGDEFYFVSYLQDEENSGHLACMERIGKTWNKPKALPFGMESLDNDMCLSADNKRLIWRSWRALPDGNAPKDHSYLWYADRTEKGWSEAKPLLCDNAPVRTGYPSISRKGTLYFAHRKDGILGIYRAERLDDSYGAPSFVTTIINESIIHGDMFIAPDERYMIVSCRDDSGKIGFGGLDLYIVFQKDNGSWTEARNMGSDINTQAGENCPQVTPDGKYLFFNRYDPIKKRGNIYWVCSEAMK